MYGLLLENLATFIRAQWGEGKWESVRRHAGIDIVAFSIHHVYPETLLRRLARSAFQVLGVDERQFFEAMGVYFVQYVSQYGYDQLLTVLGRHMRDFLNGLDNLHEYLKFSYPKMRAPSFYCDDETESGLKLHYRSKRRGFVYYVMGQIKQVADQFYNQECEIQLLREEVVGETMHVIFQLSFDNSAFTEAEAIRNLIGKDLRLPVRASTLFELFPFCIVFNSEMEITHTGHTLMTILKDLVGQIMTEAFDMTRPLIPFCFSAIMQRRNNIFELVTVAPIHDVNQLCGTIDSFDEETEGTRLRLRGQMLYMEDWNMMLYLANPVMPDLDGLVEAGLFINDLSLHDCSRDLVLAGTQQSVELKLALDQEQQKSRKLVQSMKKLDEEMRRTDELLYQMIPKQVADRIRKGESPVDTCQTFGMVSIMFTDVVNFTDICSKITPLEVVTMLNHMYFLFDQLSERNGVYKVETVGDSYMVVSGAPVVDPQHAERICDMAMDIIDASEAIEDPSEKSKGLKVRVGCHSGTVVAGVVGVKMPRYCLFGDSVIIASKMEATGDPGHIQISEACKELLPPLYKVEQRGTVAIPGKGPRPRGGVGAKLDMNTYWLIGREARVPLSKYYSKSIVWTAPSVRNLEGMNRPAADAAGILTAEEPVPILATNAPSGMATNILTRSSLRERAFSTSTPLQRLAGIVDDHGHQTQVNGLIQKHGSQEFPACSMPSLLHTILSATDSESQPLGKRLASGNFPTARNASRSSLSSVTDDLSVIQGLSLECASFTQAAFRPDGRFEGKRTSSCPLTQKEVTAVSALSSPPTERKVSRNGSHNDRDVSILRSRSLSHFVSFNGCLTSPNSVDNLEGNEFEEDSVDSQQSIKVRKQSFSTFKFFKRMRNQVSPPSPSSVSMNTENHPPESRRTSDGSGRGSLFRRSISCEPLCYRNDVIEGAAQ